MYMNGQARPGSEARTKDGKNIVYPLGGGDNSASAAVVVAILTAAFNF